MDIRVKICGLTREVDVAAAIEEGADAVGFIVGFPNSPRNLSPTEARSLMKTVPPFIESVLVTSLDDIDRLKRLCNTICPTALQLYGRSTIPVYLSEALPNTRLIRALKVDSKLSSENLLKAVEWFDAVQLDSISDEGLGGTGRVHDWRLSAVIKNLLYPKPIILAGGLNETNVSEAIGMVKPFAVDVSSSVESSPGVKDRMKIHSFIKAVKGCSL